MKLSQYHQLTHDLLHLVESDPRVLGLVALGSMAEKGRIPDQWSDHDFFLIVESGTQEDFRQSLTWLPHPERIVLNIRETAHGLKILYDFPHLLEFAVFDLAEIGLAKANDYQVLLDRGGVAEAMPKIILPPREDYNPHNDFKMILALIYVGVGRSARGEELSAHIFIKHHLLHHLLPLLAHQSGTPLDDKLDPFRRFEAAYPALGKRINRALLLSPIDCAQDLLALMLEHVHYPEEAAALKLVQDYCSILR